MDEKVYEPEIIQESPFPGQLEPVFSSTQDGSKGSYTPTTTKEKRMPVKRIAVELLSSALNTRSRKILQEFKLEQSGGIQIGNFQEGISGDTRITPDGIVMRNKSGVTTLAQDGDTGDAIFAGQLRSGSLVTGDVLITDGNFQMLDDDGVLRVFIGDDGT